MMRNLFNKKFLEKQISNKTKLIIVTDMKGMPLDYDKLKIIKIKKFQLLSIVQSHLGKIQNQIVEVNY